eukprot:4116892-Alexandrium_andersonii.AAC.1
MHPQLGECEVPGPTDPGAPANSDCRAAVGANLEGSSKPKVLGNGHKARPLSCSLDDAGQLCLSRAQGN